MGARALVLVLGVVFCPGAFSAETSEAESLPQEPGNALWFAANGLAVIQENGKWGYINLKGAWVIPPRFEDATPFTAEGLALAREDRKERYTYIDAQGKAVDSPGFERGWAAAGRLTRKMFPDSELKRVRENGKWGFVNAQGAWVIPPRFEQAWRFTRDGFAKIRENGSLGVIDTKGTMVVSPRFEEIFGFSRNGLAAVRENGKWGFVDTRGKRVIPPRFELVRSFDDAGLAWVKSAEAGKADYIDEKGRVVLSQETVSGVSVLKNAQGKIIWPAADSARKARKRQQE